MKSWIIGVFVIAIIAGGFVLSTGYASDGSNSDGQVVDDLTGTENPNLIPTIDSTALALSSEEKVSAEALTCRISDSGTHVVDLRLKNPGSQIRTITIAASGTNIDLLPGQTKRIDVPFAEEVTVISLSADDGTELQVTTPPCTTGGGSSGNGASYNKNTNLKPTPPAPVPELSPLVLTIAGISGLLLLSRTRKD